MVRFIFVAIIFDIASVFVFKYNDEPKRVFIAVFIIFVAALGSGVSVSTAPSIGKAKIGGGKIF